MIKVTETTRGYDIHIGYRTVVSIDHEEAWQLRAALKNAKPRSVADHLPNPMRYAAGIEPEATP